MQGKIWVIGDSHARAFSYNKNFIPFFIGQGKTHCFINDNNLSNLISKVVKIITEIKDRDSVILFLGEPDTRFCLGRGWKPWKKKYRKGWKLWKSKIRLFIGGKILIKKSYKRYCQLISEVKNKTNASLLILNITPSDRRDQNKLVDYFNKLLSEFCSKENDVEFIYINPKIYNPETKTVGGEYYGDPVHLNIKLQLPVENWFFEKGTIKKSFFDEENRMDKKQIKRNYKFNENFGCFTL